VRGWEQERSGTREKVLARGRREERSERKKRERGGKKNGEMEEREDVGEMERK
jgi:hypothetical protein